MTSPRGRGKHNREGRLPVLEEEQLEAVRAERDPLIVLLVPAYMRKCMPRERKKGHAIRHTNIDGGCFESETSRRHTVEMDQNLPLGLA